MRITAYEHGWQRWEATAGVTAGCPAGGCVSRAPKPCGSSTITRGTTGDTTAEMTNPNAMDTMGDLVWALDRVVNGNLSDEEDWNCWEMAAQETLDKAAKLIKEERGIVRHHKPTYMDAQRRGQGGELHRPPEWGPLAQHPAERRVRRSAFRSTSPPCADPLAFADKIREAVVRRQIPRERKGEDRWLGCARHERIIRERIEARR